ncbi:MAG: GNAT family N-acetyltransferase [Planctomycetota bacterium]|jgi:ribosomal protein S18 acetylase RimI-like enzyme
MTTVTITEAAAEDAEAIIAVQRQAFVAQAKLYSVCTIPPLDETPDDLRNDFGKSVILKAVADGRIVGSVRGTLRDDEGDGERDGDTCYVARLAVLPGLQNGGIGSALMAELEARFPDAARFELVTGHRSEKSLHLYRKLGYAPARTEEVSEKITLVFMEKVGSAASREGGAA